MRMVAQHAPHNYVLMANNRQVAACATIAKSYPNQMGFLESEEFKDLERRAIDSSASLAVLAPWMVSDLTGGDDKYIEVIAASWRAISLYIRVLDHTIDRDQQEVGSRVDLLYASTYFCQAVSFACNEIAPKAKGPIDFRAMFDAADAEMMDLHALKSKNELNLECLKEEEYWLRASELMRKKNSSINVLAHMVSSVKDGNCAPLIQFLDHLAIAGQVFDDVSDLELDLATGANNCIVGELIRIEGASILKNYREALVEIQDRKLVGAMLRRGLNELKMAMNLAMEIGDSSEDYNADTSEDLRNYLSFVLQQSERWLERSECSGYPGALGSGRAKKLVGKPAILLST
ncbi:hypothetical protein HUK65_17035 [Rhodobacteraceae bacterium 2376]|uniref:Uncharacterized protein n=1 Tax=Rhabdonatronobacter sediminivivens TaxID=2743469 RepID=A0A7Z0I2F5_9RHOB|nr:hypothetical protein [Rhabdonatronobacter sediminivivens]NYS26688.1 hypothetical protein [Rhabdonatronobacter sediminivivens]